MKKVLFSVLVLSVFVVANASAKGQAYLWGGYTAVAMKDFNDTFLVEEENSFNEAKAKGSLDGEMSIRKAKDAFVIGADYLFDVGEAVKIGPRVAFLQSKAESKARVDFDYRGERKSLSMKESYSDSLVPIMFGGSYNRNISEKFSLNGKIFFGYGLIHAKGKFTLRDEGNIIIIGQQQRKSYVEKSRDGGCFVGDISIGAQYWLTKRFGLGFDLGYRFTPKTKVGNEEKGAKRMKVDFSGLTTTLNLSYKI